MRRNRLDLIAIEFQTEIGKKGAEIGSFLPLWRRSRNVVANIGEIGSGKLLFLFCGKLTIGQARFIAMAPVQTGEFEAPAIPMDRAG